MADRTAKNVTNIRRQTYEKLKWQRMAKVADKMNIKVSDG